MNFFKKLFSWGKKSSKDEDEVEKEIELEKEKEDLDFFHNHSIICLATKLFCLF